MKGESPAKVKVEGINQIAIAVNDLERVAEDYWNILGIGPWAIYEWEEPLIYDRKYHGKPVVARERIAVVRVGGVEIELVQAVDGPSIYRDWIEERGEGLHHINFLLENADEFERVSETLAGEGFPSIQSARFGRPAQRYGYDYIDIPPLRTIWEPVFEGELDVQPVMFP
jgi:hypothetical protein